MIRFKFKVIVLFVQSLPRRQHYVKFISPVGVKMPSINLRTSSSTLNDASDANINNLPPILHTPSGLAILEIQGTIHAPIPEPSFESMSPATDSTTLTQIGRLEFPLYDPVSDASDLKWMKRVYLYVGKHQRLTGEVKKLPKPLVVVGKRAERERSEHVRDGHSTSLPAEDLEVLEVIRHKILFGGRPEPVGD